MTTTPHPTDSHVGQRIRARRRVLGMSQETLAAGLGLTFQQVQKYERGSNRVSASKLFDVAMLQGVAIGYYFEGLEMAEFQEVELAPGADDAQRWQQSDEAFRWAQVVAPLPIQMRHTMLAGVQAWVRTIEQLQELGHRLQGSVQAGGAFNRSLADPIRPAT